MALKKGDIIDEHKRHPDSCGLVLKVMNGGEGFEKILCCGHELTEEDVVPSHIKPRPRPEEKAHCFPGMTIDEKKVATDSCGLRLMIMGGGKGFQGSHMLRAFNWNGRYARFEIRPDAD